MKIWRLEYYYPLPNIRFSFTVEAETFEDAVIKGNNIVSGLRRVGTYEA